MIDTVANAFSSNTFRCNLKPSFVLKKDISLLFECSGGATTPLNYFAAHRVKNRNMKYYYILFNKPHLLHFYVALLDIFSTHSCLPYPNYFPFRNRSAIAQKMLFALNHFPDSLYILGNILHILARSNPSIWINLALIRSPAPRIPTMVCFSSIIRIL